MPEGPQARGEETPVDYHLVWNLHPGQVAQVLLPEALSTYEGARGVVVHNGTRALISLDDKPVADLQHGTYDFSSPANEREGGFLGLLSTGAAFIKDLILGHRRNEDPAEDVSRRSAIQSTLSAMPRSPHRASVLLVRQGPLPLFLALKDVVTATVAIDVALTCMVEIVDPTAFQHSVLGDRDGLGLGDLSDAFAPIVDSALRRSFKELPADSIVPFAALEERFAAVITAALGSDWQFLRVIRVAHVSGQRQEFTRLQRLRDVLHISGSALEQLIARNDFMNRLRLERNRARIQESKSEEELAGRLQEINQDGLLRDFELSRINAMFVNERRIRDAISEEQHQAALAEIRKGGLLREEELASLRHIVTQRNQDQQNKRLQTVELYDLSRRLESDRARLQWEFDIGDKRLELEMARKRSEYSNKAEFTTLDLQDRRLRDEYDDDRRRTIDQLEIERSRADNELAHAERLTQLEVAAKAQALTEGRRREQHQRDLATAAQRHQHEQERHVAEAQRWLNMSVEQIMTANPSISPAAAAALAEKYKAEAARNAGDIQAKASEKTATEMRDFIREQMTVMQSVIEESLSSTAQIAGALVGKRHRQSGAAPSVGTLQVCRKCGQQFSSTYCENCGP